ncbi:ATP-binding protein [uncultured Streptomyces sp.]|uniref:ATP-binding protein n=1 Tax=uncultured Streptomyces sp. TaxID=174707 RepID=UPI00262595C1|nr:ATP-binding protein [uncultured Streptomyces sp.]
MKGNTICPPYALQREEVGGSRGTRAQGGPSGLRKRYVASVYRQPHMVGRERRAVRVLLRKWGVAPEPSVDAVLIVVSELLSNAVLYGTADFVVLSITCTQHEIRIEVDDRTPGEWPARICPADDDENGRGLLLAAALSVASGVSEDGTVAWSTVVIGQTP